MTKKEKTHPEVEEETQKTLSKEEELQEEIEKLKDKFLRTSAELENYRKRAEKEREETTKYAISTFARELLSVADN